MKFAAKTALLAAILAAGAFYVWLRPPASMSLAAGSLAAFPTELAGWKSEEERFDDVVYKELEADATLLRRYSREDGASVWFVVVYHENERYGAHDPNVCYTAQGWTVEDEGTVTLARDPAPFDANWMLVKQRGEERLVLYWWYTAGDLATADRDVFMGRMASAGIRSNTTFGAFVRVSAPVGAGGVPGAMAIAKEFAEAAQPELSKLFVAGAI